MITDIAHYTDISLRNVFPSPLGDEVLKPPQKDQWPWHPWERFRPLSGMRYLNHAILEWCRREYEFPSPLGDEVLKPILIYRHLFPKKVGVSVPSRG